MSSRIHIGSTELRPTRREVTGELIEFEGESFYCIEGHDLMPPFLMSIVSSQDHWLFLSSAGPLSAGRRNPDHALFPYCTEDKIHDSVGVTGPQTIALVTRGTKTFLWEPLSPRYEGIYALRRRLGKSLLGHRVFFEEINEDLEVLFRQEWATGAEFGFIRRVTLENLGESPLRMSFLDGLLNILPHGVDPRMQAGQSVLVDAYKKSELEDCGLGLFSLSSIPVDRAEPSEALRATTVWSTGLKPRANLLSASQVGAFRSGIMPQPESEVRARRGAYLVHAEESLAPGERLDWYVALDVDQGPSEVAGLVQLLSGSEDLKKRLEADIATGAERLRRIVGGADGLQCTEDRIGCSRHLANVLFNVMRGGTFPGGPVVKVDDLRRHLEQGNRLVASRWRVLLDDLPALISLRELLDAARATGDPDLERLCLEYLPLSFSRRHGDPSRPWNRFSIEIRDRDGEEVLHYEGNWRDIFQNWEALARSHPVFLPGMIARFLNASTADGFNPYRITRDGFDWEVIDPADPWSNIGYWGDHQVIYLQKLLELLEDHAPEALGELLGRRIFAYADVPYRIAPYRELLRNPVDTIRFDAQRSAAALKRTADLGADGKLLRDANGELCRANLAEKLLITVSIRLTNLVHEGGIWLNTQRPEWNDANNALVGNGLSVVTVCHLRRCAAFLRRVLAEGEEPWEVSTDVATMLDRVFAALEAHRHLLEGPVTGGDRRRLLDALGGAGESYRSAVYQRGLSEDAEQIPAQRVREFLDLTLRFLDHSIRANRREDGLLHSYNLLSITADTLEIAPLYEMLEGQVAVLSSGLLTPAEATDLLDALRASAMYREDQGSYMLYPDRDLPRFTEKNRVPEATLRSSALLTELLREGDRRLIEEDCTGARHWCGDFRNAGGVRKALDSLRAEGYAALVDRDEALILRSFEDTFRHREFTGRSGTFFGYEGLGCIYWHMVSKLLLAVQEVTLAAVDQGAPVETVQRLSDHYFQVRRGLGFNKTPLEYGAFPTDPYSHTPGQGGARQPGMTGQVKEDILARWGELGVVVDQGCIRFRPVLLRRREFLSSPAPFAFVDAGGKARTIDLQRGCLSFTYCGVPVVYQLDSRPGLRVVEEAAERDSSSPALDRRESALIFERQGRIQRVEVRIDPGWLK